MNPLEATQGWRRGLRVNRACVRLCRQRGRGRGRGGAHPRPGAARSCSTQPPPAGGGSSSRRSRSPPSAAGSRRRGRPRDSQGTGAGVPGAAIPPLGLARPSPNPGPPPSSPCRLPRALAQTHLHGVGGLVQQRHVQALRAGCAAAVGAPEPVHLVLGGRRSSSSSEPPSPSGPRAGLGPLLCPPPGAVAPLGCRWWSPSLAGC